MQENNILNRLKLQEMESTCHPVRLDVLHWFGWVKHCRGARCPVIFSPAAPSAFPMIVCPPLFSYTCVLTSFTVKDESSKG